MRYLGSFQDAPDSTVQSQHQQSHHEVVDIGFIAENAGGYQLTEKGQAAYYAAKSGFCYTNGYQIGDSKVIGEEAANDLPPALS